jgi:hypothetical protein
MRLAFSEDGLRFFKKHAFFFFQRQFYIFYKVKNVKSLSKNRRFACTNSNALPCMHFFNLHRRLNTGARSARQGNQRVLKCKERTKEPSVL